MKTGFCQQDRGNVWRGLDRTDSEERGRGVGMQGRGWGGKNWG